MTTSAPASKILDDLINIVDARARRQRSLDPSRKQADPEQWQPDLMARAQLKIGYERKTSKINIRLIEPVEQHQSIGAGISELPSHVTDGAEMRPAATGIATAAFTDLRMSR
jgi:hypothetical protein